MVLEDNARTPSGVSYMLENRETMMAMFPELFSRIPVRPVSDYPRRLAQQPRPPARPTRVRTMPVVAVLTPGIYNSAYFEHAFLADQMGAELVEGSDLRVVDGRVQMRTTAATSRSTCSIAGSTTNFSIRSPSTPTACWACRGSWTSTARAGSPSPMRPGTGIADDKAIYSFMPEIVEFYTGEKPLLPNVPTWRCAEAG